MTNFVLEYGQVPLQFFCMGIVEIQTSLGYKMRGEMS